MSRHGRDQTTVEVVKLPQTRLLACLEAHYGQAYIIEWGYRVR